MRLLKRKLVTPSTQAVVTGAGSGIGQAFALEIGKRGGRVVCADIDLDRAQDTVEQLRNMGSDGLAIKVDVAKLDEVENLARQAQVYFGSAPSLVINNAGVGASGKPIGETSMADWHWVLGVNLWGVIHGCHVFAPILKSQGAGGIINVCSTASFAAAPGMGPYSTSKAAALALTETLAAELSGSGVAISALCPTFVKTNIVRDGRIDAKAKGLADQFIEHWASSPARVVRDSLRGLERGQLYVVPQVDARAIWRAKRWLPSLYVRGAGQLSRLAFNKSS